MGPEPARCACELEQMNLCWLGQSRNILDFLEEGGVRYNFPIRFGRCTRGPFLRRSKCMTKAELVEKVADKIQLTKKQTETVVNILLNCITEALSEGDKVELRGFGSFRIRKRNPREGRNPKTGDTVQIPAKRVPFFKAGKELREMVDDQ